MKITTTMSEIAAITAVRVLDSKAEQYRDQAELMPMKRAAEIAALEVEVDYLTEAARALWAGVERERKARIRKVCQDAEPT